MLGRAFCAVPAILFGAAPAAAQFAASVGIDSDYRLRGYSISDNHPAASAQFSYDDPSGLYAGISALAELHDDPHILGVIANAGYAKRLNPHVTLDAGVLRSQIRSVVQGAPGYKYTEVYAGSYVGPVSGRLYYSPDYRWPGQRTLYSELEAGFEPATDWRLSGHVGMLVYLNARTIYRAGETHRDWRVNLARQFGRVEVHSALSGGGPSTYYGFRVHKKVAFTIGTSVTF